MNTFTGKPVSLYLHFPFCIRKCRYCDFLSFPAEEEVRERYVCRLLEEIVFRGQELRGRTVPTIFIGGGTPSLMTAGQLSRIMEMVHQHFSVDANAEISMECNPGTVFADPAEDPGNITFRDMRSCRVNRLSLGLQSADNEQLAILGRIHTWEQFLANYEAARKAGFTNVNIDLMSGLPGQSCASWMKTLQAVTALEPEHISAYSLILEEGTPFWEFYGEEHSDSGHKCQTKNAVSGAAAEGYPALPDEEDERQMYEDTSDFLKDKGYLHYEISNFARPGHECRHNLTYWYRGDYLGLGLGAASLVDERRFSGTEDLSAYLQSGSFPAIESFPALSAKEQMEETMFLGLRCAAGVDKQVFRNQFGKDMKEIYGDVIRKYVSYGLMEEEGGRIRLTRQGISLSNQILADFLID